MLQFEFHIEKYAFNVLPYVEISAGAICCGWLVFVLWIEWES